MNFIGIVIDIERLFGSRKFKLCDLKLLLAHVALREPVAIKSMVF